MHSAGVIVFDGRLLSVVSRRPAAVLSLGSRVFKVHEECVSMYFHEGELRAERGREKKRGKEERKCQPGMSKHVSGARYSHKA